MRKLMRTFAVMLLLLEACFAATLVVIGVAHAEPAPPAIAVQAPR